MRKLILLPLLILVGLVTFAQEVTLTFEDDGVATYRIPKPDSSNVDIVKPDSLIQLSWISYNTVIDTSVMWGEDFLQRRDTFFVRLKNPMTIHSYVFVHITPKGEAVGHGEIVNTDDVWASVKSYETLFLPLSNEVPSGVVRFFIQLTHTTKRGERKIIVVPFQYPVYPK